MKSNALCGMGMFAALFRGLLRIQKEYPSSLSPGRAGQAALAARSVNQVAAGAGKGAPLKPKARRGYSTPYFCNFIEKVHRWRMTRDFAEDLFGEALRFAIPTVGKIGIGKS